MKNRLVPVLRKTETPLTSKPAIKKWATQLVDECQTALKMILPFTEAEQAFLAKLQDYGELDPALICSDDKLIERIQLHPALQWKIKNAKSISS